MKYTEEERLAWDRFAAAAAAEPLFDSAAIATQWADEMLAERRERFGNQAEEARAAAERKEAAFQAEKARLREEVVRSERVLANAIEREVDRVRLPPPRFPQRMPIQSEDDEPTPGRPWWRFW